MNQTSSRVGFEGLSTRLPSGRRSPDIPPAARSLVDLARDAGWATHVEWAEDSGGAPFLLVDIALNHPRHHFSLCWHTRDQHHQHESHPYRADVSVLRPRLFSCLDRSGPVVVRGPSLKAIRQLITQSTIPPAAEGGRHGNP